MPDDRAYQKGPAEEIGFTAEELSTREKLSVTVDEMVTRDQRSLVIQKFAAADNPFQITCSRALRELHYDEAWWTQEYRLSCLAVFQLSAKQSFSLTFSIQRLVHLDVEALLGNASKGSNIWHF